MRSKVDLKNDLEISGVRNSLFSITKIEKIEERTVLGGNSIEYAFFVVVKYSLKYSEVSAFYFFFEKSQLNFPKLSKASSFWALLRCNIFMSLYVCVCDFKI